MDVPSNDKKLTPVVVDLFCGAGGLSFGMKSAGLKVAAGIDIDPSCKYPFETNVGAPFFETDISKANARWVASLFPKDSLKILAGCAPCQPFSSYSRRRVNGEESWTLLSKFSSLIRAIKPEVVTMENVPRLEAHPKFQDFLRTLESSGYHKPTYGVVACAGYGVPQTRRRLVLFASRLADIEMVQPTHGPKEYPTVRGSIEGLEEIEAGQASKVDSLHVSSTLSTTNLKRIRRSGQGGTWRDWPKKLRADCHKRETGQTFSSVYGRMRWDMPGPTITTQFNGFGNGRFGHPEQNRAISLREGSLLQTFPQTYSFVPEGEDVQIGNIARLIGNAVPVKLGEAIGRSIIEHLEESNAHSR